MIVLLRPIVSEKSMKLAANSEYTFEVASGAAKNQIKKAVEQGIDKYEFGPALHALYDFIWHEVADKYIELSKKREDEEVKKVLSHVLLEILKMLHPFMPHLTEEIYQNLPDKRAEFLMVEEWSLTLKE